VTRGWVQRVDAADRRTVRLVATAQGERVAAEVAASRSDRFTELLDAIPSDQRALVLDALRLLTAAARYERGET
jgi:DNA-binding MarR family transcriptional regulator